MSNHLKWYNSLETILQFVICKYFSITINDDQTYQWFIWMHVPHMGLDVLSKVTDHVAGLALEEAPHVLEAHVLGVTGVLEKE